MFFVFDPEYQPSARMLIEIRLVAEGREILPDPIERKGILGFLEFHCIRLSLKRL